jgi:cellulose biosynthesis protein BcsQ
MNKETLFIAFSTQKGGMGKTALTVLAASYLHYVKGYNVAVIDCDYPQHSVFDMRNRDVKQIMGDDHYKRLAHIQFTNLQKKAYTIEECDVMDANDVAEKLQKTEDLDFIFFDLPGTLNKDGVLKTLARMDFIFTPISADRIVMESSLQFVSILNDNLITTGKSNIKGLHLIWTMVDGREKTPLYEVYDKAIAELGFQVLKTTIPDSKRFRKELSEEHKPIFRSTLFPADKSLAKSSNIEDLFNEIGQIINR